VDADPVERRLSKRPRQPVALPAVPNFRFGSKGDLTAPKSNFRSAPESGLKSDIGPCPFGADFVAKVG
jgi:hypothetical protein